MRAGPRVKSLHNDETRNTKCVGDSRVYWGCFDDCTDT
jgi:hypothetical protein